MDKDPYRKAEDPKSVFGVISVRIFLVLYLFFIEIIK